MIKSYQVRHIPNQGRCRRRRQCFVSTSLLLAALNCQQEGFQPTLSFGILSLFPLLPSLVFLLLLLGTADESQQRLANGEKRLGPASQGRTAVSKSILQVGCSPSMAAFLFAMPKLAHAVDGRDLCVGCKTSVNVWGSKWCGAASWCGCTACSAQGLKGS